jgi:putative membrane-bound dehydrogenase-like protein
MNKPLITLASICLLAAPSIRSNAADDHQPEVKILQPGVKLTLIAEQPDIATPTGLDVDDQGRVWAISCHTHLPPRGYQGPAHDEILVFDKDGKRSLFYNKTDQTMDLELGPDGWVYLSERDRILRIKDSDGDGKADVEEVLLELKSEADYPHNALSGLAWAPNGDLVIGLGENFAKAWTLTPKSGDSLEGLGRGGIFRCRPDGSGLRQIAEGLWNPFGMTVRQDGEIFSAENDPGENPPCKVLHIVEDGDYGYRRKYGGDEAHHPFVAWNGELRGTLPMIHPSGEAPCGLVPLGRGLLVPAWGDHRIDFFPLTPKGASFTAKQITLLHGSRYFRPVAIAQDKSQSNDKSMTWYLTDWVDGRYPVHGYGRLWRLDIDLTKAQWLGPLELEGKNDAAKLAAELRSGSGKYPQQRLFQLSRDKDPFIASAALAALARTAPNWKLEDIKKLSDEDRTQAVMALKQAKSPPGNWVPALLDDKNPNVQFETLRWVADDQLDEFLANVEQILKRSDLDYDVFEGAVAARNTLLGKPEIGLRDPEMLLSRVLDKSSSPKVRAFALRLLPSRSKTAPKNGEAPVVSFPKGLTVDILADLLAVGDPQLSLEAIRTLAANPALGQKILAITAADENQSPGLRADAIAGLSSVADQHYPLLIQLAASNQRSIREESLRALRASTLTQDQQEQLKKVASQYPESAALVEALVNPSTLAEGRPALTDTAAWLKRLDAINTPSDPEAGRRIFNHTKLALCANCHRHGGRGNVVGPDLSKIGDLGDRAWLLNAILNPNQDIAPQYLPRMITLNDGSVFTGIRLRSYVNEQIRDAQGLNHTFNRDDVKSIQDLPMSFMPTGLPMALTDRELRDLLVFLESSTSKNK